MTALRSLLFNLTFHGWTVSAALLALPPVLLFMGPRAVYRLSLVWSGVVLRALSFFCGVSHEIRGREQLPAGPCIVAAKHQSAWDTMIFLHLQDNPSYVLKRELTLLPLFGAALKRVGMVVVDRHGGAKALKRLVDDARRRLAEGRSIVIFPEGTRTAPGAHRPYHPGVAALYKQLDVPVVPVALNSGLYWGRRHFLKRPGRIVLEFLPPIAPGLPRKAFMDRLEQDIETASQRLLAEGGGLAQDRNPVPKAADSAKT